MIFWKSFTVCRIAGVPVQIHPTCLFFPVGYLLWSGWSENGWRSLWLMGSLLALLWLSLLAHEFAHIFAARGCGIRTEKMVFLPVGAVAMIESLPRSGQETWIASAGPLMSFILAGICHLGARSMEHWADGLPLLYLYCHVWPFVVLRFLRIGCEMNLFLALFNLIPCHPMDGGRIFRSLLAVTLRKFTRRSHEAAFLTATRITVRYVALPLVLCGLAITISYTHLWMHLILFPLALIVGEIEYRSLRDESPKESRDPVFLRGPRVLKLRRREVRL